MVKISHKKEMPRKVDKGVDTKESIGNTSLAKIYNAIREIRYGSVQIHIQDGKIVQIDKVNKVRMR